MTCLSSIIKSFHIAALCLLLLVITILPGFQKANNIDITGTYIQQYTIGKFQTIKKLTLEKNFQFTEKIKLRNDLGKSNFERAGSWALNENTLILYNRKDEFNNCGNNANYYEIECPNDTFIVKDNGLWSDYRQEYLRE